MKGIRQHDNRDCGFACLATIFQFYQYKVPINYLREMSRINKNGMSLFSMLDICKRNGFEAEALKGNFQEFLDSIHENHKELPCIVHIRTEENLLHYIVVLGIGKNLVECFDPAIGKKRYTYGEFCNMWTGYLVFVWPAKGFEKKDLTKGSYNRYLKILLSLKKHVLCILILSLLLSGLAIIISFAYQQVIDNYLLNIDEVYGKGENILKGIFGNITFIFTIFVSAGFFETMLTILRGRLSVLMAKKVDNILMDSYFQKLKELPYKFFQNRDTGEILSRFQEISEIRTFISESGIILIINLGMVTVCGTVLYCINEQLLGMVFIILLLYLLIILMFNGKIKKQSIKTKNNYTKMISLLKEIIDGITVLKLFDRKNIFLNHFVVSKEKLLQSNYEMGCLFIYVNGVLSGIETLGSICVLCVGGVLITKGELTLGMLMTFEALMAFFMEPVKEVILLLPNIQKNVIVLDRMNDILDNRSEEEIRRVNRTKKVEWNSININNLTFSYWDGQYVLKDVAACFLKGNMSAIIGKSGSGKSTLAKILLGIEQAEDGTVKIDGVDLNRMPLSELRKNVIYVPQEIFLFNSTVRDNLFLDSTVLEKGFVEEILLGCRVWDILEHASGGFDFIVGENGENFSGGEKQRLAVARALLKNPKVLILDEATNQMEETVAFEIINFIKKRFLDTIVIIITHDSRIAKVCDSCVELKSSI